MMPAIAKKLVSADVGMATFCGGAVPQVKRDCFKTISIKQRTMLFAYAEGAGKDVATPVRR
jgi:hypothetical protein